MKHTPGPWKLRDTGYEFSKDIVQAKPSEWVIKHNVPSDQAARIVACVNALEGVQNPEALREFIQEAYKLMLRCDNEEGVQPDGSNMCTLNLAMTLEALVVGAQILKGIK